MSGSLIAFDKLRARLDELERRLANLEFQASPPAYPAYPAYPAPQPPQQWDGLPGHWNIQTRD